MAIRIHRGDERFVTLEEGRETRHSFSFGPHYDPANLGFAGLLCHNDDQLSPGSGYPDHPHQEIEVVTWVLTGALAHRDSTGSSGVLLPGRVQVMSAGSGVVHSEYAEPGAGPTRFVQTWVRPAEWGAPPGYASAQVDPGRGWTAVVGGDGLPVRAPGATLRIASPEAGDRLVVPEAAHAHLFVATGAVELDGASLAEGDVVRLTGEGAELRVTAPGQLMLWAFSA